MKGDFTRFTHKPAKHYAGVLKQQGRVDLDADWNEYVSIQDYLRRIKTKDIIGPCGVPCVGGGFRIDDIVSSEGPDLTISPGRIYVHGILCELENMDATYLNQPDYPNPPQITPVEGRTDLIYLDVWRRHITAIEDPQIRETALGGPDTTTRIKTVWQVKMLEDVGDVVCRDEINGWPPSPSGGRLSTDVVPTPAADDPCLLTPGGGYCGLENRLYRMEIHNVGDIGTATFKWSRDNGSVVYSIEEFVAGEPNKVKLTRLGRDHVLALHKGDWVEVLGDETELKEKPGTLARIEDIDEAHRLFTLSDNVSAHSLEGHPKVRRWDQGSDAIPVTSGLMDLEDGIRIRFSGSNFKTGDYWVFAARAAIGDIEHLNSAPPLGINHHYCRLAILTWHVDSDGNITADVLDCRRPFPHLTELPTGRSGCCCTITVGQGVGCGDGYTDIQTAIDALGDGGRLCILPGEYRLRQTILIQRRNNIIIRGCGRQTRIIGPAEGPAFLIENSNRVGIEYLDVRVENIQGPIQVRESRRIHITECWITNYAGWPSLSLQAQTLKVIHNHITGGGIWICDGTTQVLIKENKISDGHGPGPGIGLGCLPEGWGPSDEETGVSGVEIIDNYISRMNGSGISTIASSDPWWDLSVGDIEDLTIAHNRIVGCVRTGPDEIFEELAVGGVVLREVSFIRIHDNEIIENGAENQIPACGIFTFMCHGLEVTDNRIMNNGTKSECIDFGTMQTGIGPNPREEQGMRFTVTEHNGEIPDNTEITAIEEYTGLDCNQHTKITLSTPSTFVELTLFGPASGSETTIEAFNMDDTSVGSEKLPEEEQPRTFRFTGSGINRVEINAPHNETLLLQFCFGKAQLSYQAGIAAIYVSGGFPPEQGETSYKTGIPAARIHDNIVVCPRGQALLIVGAGAISIADNTLTTQGIRENPVLRPDFQFGRCIFIVNLGETPGFGNVISGFGTKISYNLINTGPADTAYYATAPGLPGGYGVDYIDDGRVLFHGNQVTLQAAGYESEKTIRGSVYISSNDDVSLQDNQIMTEIAGVMIYNVSVSASTIRASGNRFTEFPSPSPSLWGFPFFSYFSNGNMMNITTNNQATHCIFTVGGKIIEENNQIMLTNYCNPLANLLAYLRS